MLTLVPAVALDPACPPFCSVLFPPLPSSKYRLLPDTEIVPSLRRFPQQNKNFGGVSFGIDGDGNYGYYGADGSLVPFKKGECQLVSIGTIGGNGSFSVPTKYQSNGIIAIPTTVTITTNSYGNCRLTQTFNGTSPAWSYNKDTGVVTTANSYWVICNDSGSIIYGGIAWTVYAVIVK